MLGVKGLCYNNVIFAVIYGKIKLVNIPLPVFCVKTYTTEVSLRMMQRNHFSNPNEQVENHEQILHRECGVRASSKHRTNLSVL